MLELIFLFQCTIFFLLSILLCNCPDNSTQYGSFFCADCSFPVYFCIDEIITITSGRWLSDHMDFFSAVLCSSMYFCIHEITTVASCCWLNDEHVIAVMLICALEYFLR